MKNLTPCFLPGRSRSPRYSPHPQNSSYITFLWPKSFCGSLHGRQIYLTIEGYPTLFPQILGTFSTDLFISGQIARTTPQKILGFILS